MSNHFNLSESVDLTRWNRAGLSQINYINGNAATYQESLREMLRKQFSQDETVLQWLGDEANDATVNQWQQRLIEQYQGERRDYVWELFRSFARAVHILAHTADAYANERYIRTATQWDNVRRLVNMLDYYPAPPASAECYVALFAKEDEQAIGTVNSGLAIKNEPDDGSAPLTFETLNDLSVDYRLNLLMPTNHDRSAATLRVRRSSPTFRFYPDEMPENISVGARAILTDNSRSIAVSVRASGDNFLLLTIIEHSFTSATLNIADVKLLLVAEWKEQPKINGTNVIEVSSVSASVKQEDVLVFPEYEIIESVIGGKRKRRRRVKSFNPRQVKRIEGNRVELNSSIGLNKILYPTLAVKLQDTGEGNRFVIPIERDYRKVWLSNLSASNTQTQQERDADGDTTGIALYHYIDSATSAKVYYLASETPSAFKVINTSPQKLTFEGSRPENLSSGGCILLKTEDGDWYSRKIRTVEENENDFSIQVTQALPNKSFVLAESIYENQLPAKGYNQNNLPIYSGEGETSSNINIELDELPESLVYGRFIWLVNGDETQLATLISAEKLPHRPGVQLTVSPSLKDKQFPKSTTQIYANVVLAGHGEIGVENILGNGDRIQTNQTFSYQKNNIAFVQDSEFSSGVKAAVDVYVGLRKWTQVDSLRDSETTDTHYQTNLNEEGHLQIMFGDGINAQRLPSGVNNVRIQARFGHGIEGNLAAESLTKLKKPHHLVESVIQPSAATGGGDLEDSESLRTNAPASVLTLSRAVSIGDFKALAQAQSSVWHAQAYTLPERPGLTDRIAVVVVPAGGGELGTLGESLAKTLTKQAQPNIEVSVKSYRAILLSLQITLRVDEEAYNKDAVIEAVKLALVSELSLQNASFGKVLYRSRIFQIVESVEGVENADCVINPNGFINEQGAAETDVAIYRGDDGFIRKITPKVDQIIYLNNEVSPPVVK